MDNDDDEDDDDEDGDDDFITLAMRGIPSFSSLILPLDGLRWLWFYFVDGVSRVSTRLIHYPL